MFEEMPTRRSLIPPLRKSIVYKGVVQKRAVITKQGGEIHRFDEERKTENTH